METTIMGLYRAVLGVWSFLCILQGGVCNGGMLSF